MSLHIQFKLPCCPAPPLEAERKEENIGRSAKWLLPVGSEPGHFTHLTFLFDVLKP